MIKIGDQFIVADSLDSPSIRIHTCTATGKSGGEKTISASKESVFYAGFCWPITAKDELLEILKTRQALKKEFDDSMKLIYELKNRIANGEN